MGRFSDELLCSALSMVLQSPDQLVSRTQLVPAMVSGLHFGQTHLRTAEITIGALEEWLPKSPEPEVLQLLLPLLNPYLLEDIQTAGLDADTGLARRLAKQGRTQDAVGYDDLRLRIVRLLGRLGGNNRFIVATVDQLSLIHI